MELYWGVLHNTLIEIREEKKVLHKEYVFYKIETPWDDFIMSQCTNQNARLFQLYAKADYLVGKLKGLRRALTAVES